MQVVFRKFPDDGSVIALFPGVYDSPGCIMSYMHVGQHGGASWNGCLSITRPAKVSEYSPLLRELQAIGYNDLTVCTIRRGRITLL